MLLSNKDKVTLEAMVVWEEAQLQEQWPSMGPHSSLELLVGCKLAQILILGKEIRPRYNNRKWGKRAGIGVVFLILIMLQHLRRD